MMKKLIQVMFVAVCLPMLTACPTLMTRTDVRDDRQRKDVSEQVTTLQRANADVSSRFNDIDEDIRQLHGRVEVVENRLTQYDNQQQSLAKGDAERLNDSNQKFTVVQQELIRMQNEIDQLKGQLANQQAQSSAAAAQAAADSKKGPMELAEEAFERKEWRKAILNYQKYRETTPKGKKVAEATYKMGVCFQELGMNDEAKTFYDEVVAKFGKSDEARRARTRLKSLKK